MLLLRHGMVMLFASFPASVAVAAAVSIPGHQYYRIMYVVASGAFLAASAALGLCLPAWLRHGQLARAWLWILLAGLLAWGVALAVLGALSLTPLCVGQDNGDGHNDLGLCLFQAAAVGAVYSPVALGLMAFSAGVGHALLRWSGLFARR